MEDSDYASDEETIFPLTTRIINSSGDNSDPVPFNLGTPGSPNLAALIAVRKSHETVHATLAARERMEPANNENKDRTVRQEIIREMYSILRKYKEINGGLARQLRWKGVQAGTAYNAEEIAKKTHLLVSIDIFCNVINS